MTRIIYWVGRIWFVLADRAVGIVYNLSLLIGIGSIAHGVGEQFGRPWFWIALGVLVLLFTLYGAERLHRRSK